MYEGLCRYMDDCLGQGRYSDHDNMGYAGTIAVAVTPSRKSIPGDPSLALAAAGQSA
jgi:hypothetical protein